ncbi:glycosyltransferase [bacterium]|nr:glycosyltransferase [bacterium]
MTALSILAVLAWVVVTLTQALVGRRLQTLPGQVRTQLPRLSVLVPACNEQSTLAAALTSLLAVNYPNLEIVLVNDRSTDSTGDLMESLAASDPRVQVVHVRQLPPGWLGKTHALQVASRVAGGDWLLFTDADVHFEPDALSRAVTLALDQQLDHLCLGPRLVCGSFWEKIFVALFCTAFLFRYRPDLAARPGPAHVGVGAFNLVRASAYRHTGGHSSLALQVLDDMELGRLLKQRGFRQAFVGAGSAVRVRWAVGLSGQVQVLEKNAYAGLGYSIPVALGATAITVGACLAPLWLAWKGLWGWACLGYGCMLVCGLISWIGLALPPWTGLFYPLAGLVLGWVMLRSCWLCERQGGIVWRGTFYDLRALRAHRLD